MKNQWWMRPIESTSSNVNIVCHHCPFDVSMNVNIPARIVIDVPLVVFKIHNCILIKCFWWYVFAQMEFLLFWGFGFFFRKVYHMHVVCVWRTRINIPSCPLNAWWVDRLASRMLASPTETVMYLTCVGIPLVHWRALPLERVLQRDRAFRS